MKKTLTGTWPKKKRTLAGPNEWQQVCNRSNPEKKTGLSCGGADFRGGLHYGPRAMTMKF
jgi:hypothetical protein